MRLPAIRPLRSVRSLRLVRLQPGPRIRRILREVVRGCGWLSLGLGLGALTDLVVRLVA